MALSSPASAQGTTSGVVTLQGNGGAAATGPTVSAGVLSGRPLVAQNNAQVQMIDRASGKIVGSFARSGTFPGRFNQPHAIAVDSRGNVYGAENRGRRIHKFTIASR